MNKRFVKTFILSLLAILSVSVMFFTACDPGQTSYNLDELRAPVKSIELVNYDNPNQKSFKSWVPDHSDDLKPLDMSAIQVIETLDAERIDSFMADLCEEQILYKYYAYDSPNSTCIKIVYEDNYFDIVSCNDQSYAGYIGTFAPNGEVVDFMGCFSSYYSFKYLRRTYFSV